MSTCQTPEQRTYLIGKLYRETKKERTDTLIQNAPMANNLPTGSTAERIAEQHMEVEQTICPTKPTAECVGERSTSLTGRETKKAPSGRADREFGGQIVCPPKTAERIAEQFNGPDRETKKEQGEHTGNQYTMERANNLPLPKAEDKIAEQFNGPDRETKKDHGGDRRSAGASSPQNGDLKTVDLIADQFNVGKNTVLRAEKFADAVDTIASTYGDEA